MYKIPSSVKIDAKKGLLMHRKGFMGGTPTGWGRAVQLSSHKNLDEHTIRTMKAWFARHEYTSYPGYLKWKRDGSPVDLTKSNRAKYRGAVAWLLWGGDPAKKWLQTINLK